MKEKKRLIEGFVVAVFLVVIMSGSCFAESVKEKRGFDVDNILLKLTVRQGESLFKTIKVTNTGFERINFKIDKENLDFISISEQEFSLGAGEAKSLELDFDIEGKDAGVYLGRILVSSGKILAVPVVLEIETKEVLFDSNINVPPEYSSIYPGEKAIIETQIFNLENLGLKTLEVTYIVRDFKGKTIFSEQENIAITTETSTTKIISIPKDIETGDYIFITIVKYDDSIGTSSYFFKIVEKTFEFKAGLFPWIVIFLLFGLVFFIIYYIRQRDKMFLELERQYRAGMREEIKKQEKKKERIIKLKPAKRKIALRKFRKKKKKRLKAIRKIHRTRVKVLRKLKRQKKKKTMQGKLAQWKKQGYNVNEFLIKTAKPEKKNLKGRAAKLKKQGYKI